MSNTRQEGYYWVKLDDLWIVSEWEGSKWWTMGLDYHLSFVQEINETRLPNPDEVKQKEKQDYNTMMRSMDEATGREPQDNYEPQPNL